jgi:hypothetical protein
MHGSDASRSASAWFRCVWERQCMVPVPPGAPVHGSVASRSTSVRIGSLREQWHMILEFMKDLFVHERNHQSV